MAKRAKTLPKDYIQNKATCLFCDREFYEYELLWQISPDATYWAAMCWDCAMEIYKGFKANKSKGNGKKL